MWLTITAIVFLIVSIEFLKYKYKIMHKSRHKIFLAIIHLLILIVNVILFLLLLDVYSTPIPPIAKVIAIIFVLIGLMVILWTIIHLKKQLVLTGNKVIKTGPFRYTRHPIYTSDIAITFGASLYAGSLSGFIFSIVLTIVLHYLAKEEEKELVSRLKGYKEYMKSVHRLI